MRTFALWLLLAVQCCGQNPAITLEKAEVISLTKSILRYRVVIRQAKAEMELELSYGLRPFNHEGIPEYVMHDLKKHFFVFNGQIATKSYQIGFVRFDRADRLKIDLNLGAAFKLQFEKFGVHIADEKLIYCFGLEGNVLFFRYQADLIREMFTFCAEVSPDGELQVDPHSLEYDSL